MLVYDLQKASQAAVGNVRHALTVFPAAARAMNSVVL